MLNEVKRAFSENKLAICSSIAILFISLILGYFLEPYLHDFFNPVVEDLTQKVKTGVIQITFTDIFFNNIKIVFQMFIYGLMCCFSAVILTFNGFFVGYYVATTGDLFTTLMYIVPHGIFEFSSCILACASGFVLFDFLYKFLKTLINEEDVSIRHSLYNSYENSCDKLKQALIIFVISAILMAIAGFIEAYLTLPIANFVLSI